MTGLLLNNECEGRQNEAVLAQSENCYGIGLEELRKTT
jgi:hypothetical protein